MRLARPRSLQSARAILLMVPACSSDSSSRGNGRYTRPGMPGEGGGGSGANSGIGCAGRRCEVVASGCDSCEACDGLDSNCHDSDELCACAAGAVQARFAEPPSRRDVGACQNATQRCQGARNNVTTRVMSGYMQSDYAQRDYAQRHAAARKVVTSLEAMMLDLVKQLARAGTVGYVAPAVKGNSCRRRS